LELYRYMHDARCTLRLWVEHWAYWRPHLVVMAKLLITHKVPRYPTTVLPVRMIWPLPGQTSCTGEDYTMMVWCERQNDQPLDYSFVNIRYRNSVRISSMSRKSNTSKFSGTYNGGRLWYKQHKTNLTVFSVRKYGSHEITSITVVINE